jgi:hypothetical protein
MGLYITNRFVLYMAARRRGRVRTRTRTIVRRARSSGGGFKPIIDGFLAGAGGQLASGFLGNLSHPVVTLGVGFFRNNNVLKVEGARELGAMLASGGIGGLGGGGGGGVFN